jgi:outer membrane receptor for ferric coprogen and ferric-rhodotorulic acid
MYDLDEHYSLYASYAHIYQTVGETRRVDGTLLGPTSGVDIEAGIKGAWRNGALNASLVLYRITQDNVPLLDLTSPRPSAPVLYCCYQSGTNRSKGVDAEVNGAVGAGWLIGAGYTFNINHAAEGGDLSSWTPRHLLKLWTSKQLSGSLHRWALGGNVRAQSGNSKTGTDCLQATAYGVCIGESQSFVVSQAPYIVVDLRASLQIDRHWRAALSVNNVFDRVYYETVGVPQMNSWYGEPRGLLLRIDGSS